MSSDSRGASSAGLRTAHGGPSNGLEPIQDIAWIAALPGCQRVTGGSADESFSSRFVLTFRASTFLF